MCLAAPDWKASILITIDVQNDFALPESPGYIPGTNLVLPHIGELLSLYRQKGMPILHVVRLYLPDGSNAEICRREKIAAGAQLVAPGTTGAELPLPLRPHGYAGLCSEDLLAGAFQPLGNGEWAMFKPRWGAFYKTKLEIFLRELGVTTLLFTGCNFPNCPRTTLYEASERDFKLALVTDGTSGLYERGLTEIAGIGVTLLTSAQVLAHFTA